MNKVIMNETGVNTFLKFLLCGIGAVAALTALNIVIGGAASVPGATTAVDPAVDNELRFFSVFWLAYGLLCVWVATDLQERSHFIPILSITFIIGGIARLISLAIHGNPGLVLMLAMILELTLPLLIYFLNQRRSNFSSQI